jgi:TPR repeat protein
MDLRPGEGLADGYIALAQIHLDGKLVPVDRNKAIELLQQAAALPSGRAHFELSRLLAETGLGDEKSILNHLRQGVELNHPPAIRTLALRLTGEAREFGRTREEWLQAAAKGGDMRSGIELALNGDGPASIEAALDRIWEGQSCKPDQMLELALAYAKLKTPTAASKAYRWLRRAEIYGNDSASHYYSMASAYLSGLRAHADPSRAEALLKRAHELGHPRALRRLASAYLDGDIPSGNREEASRILREAAQQGHVDAALKLIEIDIEASPGGRLSPEKAKEIQRLFALIMPQSVEATREFGLLILKGHFADLKTDTAIALIRRAAETGDTIAMRELGNAYANGLGVERRPDQFVRWISQAASKGDAEAMFKLSAAYEAGFGVEPNRSEAERWITEARRAGGPSSKLR